MMRKFLAALLLLPALACAQILSGTSTSTGFGATPGISGQLTQPSFAAALTTTIVPAIALGSPTATFTRATTATVTDQDSIVRSALSGEVRFQGARRVRNHIVGTETSAGWGGVAGGTGSVATVTSGFTAPDGTTTAFRIVANLNGGATGSDSSYMDFPFGGPKDMAVPVHSIWLKNNGGQNIILLRHSSAVVGYTVTIDNTWRRYSMTSAAFAGGVGAIFTVGTRGNINPGSFVDVLVWHPQFEDAVGQSNPNPSEYVSSGVLAAPFQGANVDGVQYFGTLNGNTVASNVVTAGNGATIPSATLLGYLAEGARTNLILQSENLGTSWTNTNSTNSLNATVAPDGNTTADKLIEDATAATAHIIATSNWTDAAATYTFSVWAKAAERTRFTLSVSTLHLAGGASGSFNLTAGTAANGTNATSFIQAYPNGWYRCWIVYTATLSAAGSDFINLADGTGATTYNGDGVSGMYFWGADVELGAFPSSYIPTTTVAVTRNEDFLTYPFASNISASVGTGYAEATVPWAIAPGTTYLISTGGGGATALLGVGNTAPPTDTLVRDGTNVVTKSGLTSMQTGVRKRASSWGGAGLLVTGDGAASASGAFDGDIGSAAIGIGVNPAGGNDLWGTIRNVLIFPAQFTDAQLQGKTGP